MLRSSVAVLVGFALLACAPGARADGACPPGFPGGCRGLLSSKRLRLLAVLGDAATTAPLVAVGAAADGRRMVALRADGALDVWDLGGGAPKTIAKRKYIALSPDARWAVATTGGTTRARDDDFDDRRGAGIELWELGADRRVAALKKPWEELAFSFSSSFSPRVILGGSFDGDVGTVFWDTRTGKLGQLGQDLPCEAFAVSRDGGRALCSEQGQLGLWDLDRRKRVRAIGKDKLSPHEVAFSADGRRAVVLEGASHRITGDLSIWDTATGKALARTDGGGGRITAMSVSPEGNRAALLGEHGDVSLVDAGARDAKPRFIGVEGAKVTDVAFLPDGKRVLAGDDTGVMHLWDFARAAEVRASRRVVGHTSEVEALSFTADGRRLFSVSKDGTARVWDAGAWRLERTIRRQFHGSMATGLVAPDGAYAVSGLQGLEVLDLATGKVTKTVMGGGGAVNVTALSPDGTYALAGQTLWEVPSGREVWKSNDVGLPAAFSPDQRFLYTWGARGLRALDVESGRPRGEPLAEGSGGAGALAVSAQNDFLIAGPSDARGLKLEGEFDVVSRLELPSGRRTWRTPVRQYVRSVALSPDGKLFVSAGPPHLKHDPDRVAYWPPLLTLGDAATGAALDTIDLTSTGASARTVTFTRDGKRLLVGTSMGPILVFELRP